MRTAADRFRLVARRHLEFDLPSLDLDDLGFGADLMADGGRGKMPDIDRGADRALARIEIWPDRGERRVFHEQDHHRRRQHLRQHGVLEAVGEMLRLYPQRERGFGSQRYLAHAIILSTRRYRRLSFR